MTDFVIENLRLKELLLVVEKNKPFYLEFQNFSKAEGYPDIISFVSETDEKKFLRITTKYFATPFDNPIYDGIEGSPFSEPQTRRLLTFP